MRNFKELGVWQESRVLTKEIYLLTNSLPHDEKFGLISQIRRCVISIPSNIAEGAAKDSQKDFLRYLQISLGSSFELEIHLILCADLELLSKEKMGNHIENIERIQKRISSLIKFVKTQI
ncbi:four helix bundle protein [Flavobacterium sp.]|uniref:four helix bundle protein n=1 Tax=Flavobacterium sp. TaxID=239 RepID=UPI00286E44B7|nr:four helix bundle protein [Flavobacterium sp.]